MRYAISHVKNVETEAPTNSEILHKVKNTSCDKKLHTITSIYDKSM